MPSIQEIERFKQVLNELGSEPAILAERSEEIEDLPPPEEATAAEPDALFQPMDGGEREDGPADSGPASAAGGEDLEADGLSALDFESLFGEPAEAPLDTGAPASLPEEEPAAPESAPMAPEPPAGPSGGREEAEERLPEDFELLDLPPPGEEPFDAKASSFADLFPEEPGMAETGGVGGDAVGEGAVGEGISGEGRIGEGTGTDELPDFGEFPGAELPEGEEAAPAGDEAPTAEESFSDLFGLPQEVPAGGLKAEPPPDTGIDLGAEGGAEAGAGVDFSPEEWGLPEELPADMGPGPDTEETRDTAGEEPGGQPPAAAPSDGEIAASEGEFPAEGPGEGDFQLDEFLLPKMEEPSVPEDREGPPEAPGAAAFSPPAGDEEDGPAVPAAEEGLELSDEEFAALQSALASLPRKLKMAVEELVAVRRLAGPPLRSLVNSLVEGASPSSIAVQVFRITGQRIHLPPGYEKRTGLAFEDERRTFAYAFRENILPILRAFVLGGLLLSVLAYAGYRFVYRPIHAWSLYRSGYALLEQGDYPPANRDFERATGVHPMRGWYFRYAEGFIGRRQYSLAEEKYEQLLKRYPGDREGRLAYARLETTHLANFEKAEEQLNLLLKEDFRDYDALLLRGDTYLEWAAEEETYYEKARFDYAQAMDFRGRRNDVLFRMLRYFIRTDNLEETRKLKRGLESQPRLKVDPQVYAELGGYLLDRSGPQGHPKALDEVQATLFRALKVNPDVPEAHYHLARFYRRVADPGEEEKALKQAIERLNDPGAPGDRRRIMLIDSHDRLGRLYWTRRQYLDAEQEYQTAKEMIETGQKSGGLGRNPVFGEVYHNLADIYYYVDRNGETALGLYEKAGENGYRSAAMDYKMGYVEYTGGRFDAALLQFAKAAEDLPDNPNVLYALANTLYHRGDYYSAEGYYLHLLRLLEARRGRFPTLQPEVDPEHRALVANTMRVYNNLGVTLSRLSERSGDRRKYSQSLAHLTFASEYFDVLRRDPDTLARGDTKNLAFLNQRYLLYPPSGFELQLYNLIPLDPDARELQE